MTAPRNPDRLIRAFLAEGQDELPDQVYDAVRDRIEQTNQRVVVGPWRTPIMNNTVRLTAASAVVLVAALIGYQLLIAPNVGGPAPAPSASEAPSTAPTVTPAPSEGSGNVFPPAGRLEVGTRYAVTLFEPPADTPLSFTFAVPTEGWSSGEGVFIGHSGSPQEIQLNFSNLDNHIPGVFPDPCIHEGLQAYGAYDWMEAITSIPRTEVVSGPTDVVVDSQPGRSAVIAIPQDVGCARDEFWLSFAAECPLTEPCYQFPHRLGESIHEWIVDVEGTLFEVQAQVLRPDQNPDVAAELQQIVDSIQFE